MSRLMLPLSVLLLVLQAAFSELGTADKMVCSQEQERRDKPPTASSKEFTQVSQSVNQSTFAGEKSD